MNYFRLLWNLYQQKQNAQKARRQIEILQKKKLHKMLRYAYKYSPYYRKAFEAVGIKADKYRKETTDYKIRRTYNERKKRIPSGLFNR